MSKDEHNAPGFYYLVKWRRHDLVEREDFHERIVAADQSSLTISDQPVYKPYELYVLAVNRMGEAVSPPRMVVGYSSEDGKGRSLWKCGVSAVAASVKCYQGTVRLRLFIH